MSNIIKNEENTIKKKMRSETLISENQFGFMPGKSTTEPLFYVRQLVKGEEYTFLHSNNRFREGF